MSFSSAFVIFYFFPFISSHAFVILHIIFITKPLNELFYLMHYYWIHISAALCLLIFNAFACAIFALNYLLSVASITYFFFILFHIFILILKHFIIIKCAFPFVIVFQNFIIGLTIDLLFYCDQINFPACVSLLSYFGCNSSALTLLLLLLTYFLVAMIFYCLLLRA